MSFLETSYPQSGSLMLHFPPPPKSTEVAEYDSVLLSAELCPPAAQNHLAKWNKRVDSLLLTPTSLPGHGIAATASSASSTSSAHFEPSNSAKSAFLPPRHEKQLQVRKAVSTWLEEGWISALESLVATSPSSAKTAALWNRVVQAAARAVLGLYRVTSNIHSSFNPHLMMSGEDMIARFSETADWRQGCLIKSINEARVRCMAFHPHTDKIAIAVSSFGSSPGNGCNGGVGTDDAIHVMGERLAAAPVLKCKQQKGVSCMAWRPLNASELAVGCLGGCLVWTVDPTSVATRPSASCVAVLSAPKGHAPVTGVEWDPRGKLLLTCSAADTSMILWNTASESMTPIRRIGGGGVHMVSWSSDARFVLAGTPSKVFRVWDARQRWSHERWNVLQGRVQTACWSPCSSVLLFTTTEDPFLFALNFRTAENASAAAANAVPVADLSHAIVGEDEEIAGGIVQSLRWDPSGSRVAATFADSALVAVFASAVSGAALASLTPIGFVRGFDGERPSCIEFAKRFNDGALLAVAWSSGRVQFVPMLFMPSSASAATAAAANTMPTIANLRENLVLNADFNSSFRAAENEQRQQFELFSTQI